MQKRCEEVFFKVVASSVLVGATIWSNNEVVAGEEHNKVEEQLERIRKVARSWLLVEDNFSVYSMKAKGPPCKKGRGLINS